MKPLAVGLVVALLSGHAEALDARSVRVLMRTEPDTRLEQVCDIEAMHRIAKIGSYRPDRAKSDVSLHPQHVGDHMVATGAAFRSKGTWYAFSFECTGTPDHLKVTAFRLGRIEGAISPSRWAEFGLWR